jgi:putative flippase GtrA
LSPELKDKQTVIQLIKFTAISVIGYLIRTPIFTILENPILDFLAKIVRENFPVDLVLIAHNISLAIVIIIVLFWNYFANRFWTYRELLKGDENEIESS